jgi:hypothetical protein
MKSFPLSHWLIRQGRLTQWPWPLATVSQNIAKFDLPALERYTASNHTPQDDVGLDLGFTHPNFRHWTWFVRSSN